MHFAVETRVVLLRKKSTETAQTSAKAGSDLQYIRGPDQESPDPDDF